MDSKATQEPAEETQGKHVAAAATGPAVPSRARTSIYIVCLAVNVLTLLGFGLAEIFDALDPEKSAKATTLILGAVGMISTGLSVGYRPTRPGAPA